MFRVVSRKYNIDMEYKTSEHSTKSFLIDFGLRPGYNKTVQAFSLEDVKQWYMDWQKERANKEEYYFSGIVIPSNFVYAYKSEDGSVIGDYEPAARIEGEVSMDHCASIYDNDEKILEIIFELANTLGMHAQQERIHVVYGGKSYILQK